MLTNRTGGEILVKQLVLHNVKLIFIVPGESYLAALDALYSQKNNIKVIVCRHEAAACNMAEAYAKLTGNPGVCFVTRGPGACHASIGVHTAQQDSSPLILLVGQVPTSSRNKESFQEVNYYDFFVITFYSLTLLIKFNNCFFFIKNRYYNI